MLISEIRDDLCLAYANTLSWRGSAVATEKLYGLPDLLGWLETGANVAGPALQEIKSWFRDHPKKAGAVFAEAIHLREAMFRIFEALATGAAVRDADFAALKAALAEAPTRRQLVRADGRYAWRLETLRPSASNLLTPVLWSAGDLMLNAERRRIRQCANEKCLWLFLDESKSGTRRWCDMTSCGNRAKAQRHYSKIKQS